MNSYRKFIRDNSMVTVGHTLIYAKGITLLSILIKNMGANLYGGYVLLVTGMGFISGIPTFGVGYKFRRFIPSTEGVIKRRNLFYPQFLFQLISVFVVSMLLIISSNFVKTTIFKNQLDFSMYLIDSFLNTVNYTLRGLPVYVHLNGLAS